MPCPRPEELQQLLDETLPLEQQSPLHIHIDTCPACQKAIERLAAGGVTWDKTAQNLADKPQTEERALADALSKLEDTPTSAIQTQAEPISTPLDEGLSFLQPSQKPNSLGRLDEFEILSVLGKGGFGVVLKAFDDNLHRIVALKVMLPHLAANGQARQRFDREAKAAAAITHENVVTIHKVEGKAKTPYLVMQFVSGVTLNQKIDDDGALSIKEILRISMQIAEGLAAAQKHGLIHRDIKPGNILLENGIERVKITDFGLARTADDASVTQSGTVAGTPMYMSPEQANGEPVDHRSDLFSLGSVMYVMCTGRPPFRASTTMAVMKRVCDETPTPVQQVNTDIPPWLGDIIAKLHAKKPGERYQTAKEVAELLGQHLAHLQQPQTAALPAPVSPPSAEPTQSRDEINAPLERKMRVVLLQIIGLLGWILLMGAVWLGFVGGHPLFIFLAIVMGLGGFVLVFVGRDQQRFKADHDGLKQPELAAGLPPQPATAPVSRWLWIAVTLMAIGNACFWGGVSQLWLPETRMTGWLILAAGLPFLLGAIQLAPNRAWREKLVAGGVLCAAVALLQIFFPLTDGPRTAPPMEAHDVLKRLVGTWSIDLETTTPKPAMTHGKVRFDWIVHGKFLRAYAVMDNGNESVTMYSYDARTKTFRRWFFASDAGLMAIQGPQEGHWDAKTSLLSTQGELPLFHKIAHEDHWTDADNFEIRTVVTDQNGAEAARQTKKMHRLAGDEPIGPKAPPDPKRPHEFALLDKLLGVWTNNADVTLAEVGGQKVQSQSTAKEAAILTGRFVESHEHTPRGDRHDYTIIGYDQNRKTYRFWHFNLSGDVTEADGVLNKDENELTWKSLDGRLNGRWTFVTPDERRAKMSAKDAQGRRLYEVTAVATRNGADTGTQLRGAWTLEKAEFDGKPLPIGDKLRMEFQFGDKDFEMSVGDSRDRVQGTFRIDLKKKMLILEIVDKPGQKPMQVSCPFRIDGKRLSIEFPKMALIGARDGNPGDGSILLEFQRSEPADPTWVQLFNGKNLEGWKYHPEMPGGWKVQDGLLTSGGAASYLFSDLGDYADFHLRAEAKVNKDGNSGVFFRAPFNFVVEAGHKKPYGPEAQIFGGARPGFAPTGTLLWTGATGSIWPKEYLTPADEWFLLEVTTTGNRVLIKVNGKTTVDRLMEGPVVKKGHIALQQFTPETVVHFKKIEIKELPPGDPRQPTPLYDARFQKPVPGWAVEKGKRDGSASSAGGSLESGFADGRYFLAANPKAVGFSVSPTEPMDQFACAVVGRVIGAPSSGWSLGLQHATQKRWLIFELNGKQELEIRTAELSELKWRLLRLQLIEHPAIKPGGALNKLLVVSRQGQFEVFVNDVAIGQPVMTDFVNAPFKLGVWVHSGGNKGITRAEFESFTVWAVIQSQEIEIKEPPPSAGPSYGLLFDGEKSYVEIPTLQYDGDHPLTVEGYFTPHQPRVAAHGIIAIGGRTAFSVSQGQSTQGAWRSAITNSKAVNMGVHTTDAVKLHERTHVAAVFDGKKIDVYVNGQLAQTKPYTPLFDPARALGKPSVFGRLVYKSIEQGAGRSWAGTMSDVRISKVARYTQNFVPAKRFTTDPNTIALYHCDEGQGDKLTDSSGNNHHGKIVGATWVKGSPVEARPLTGIVEQGVLDFTEIHDADEKQFDAWLAQMKKDGYRPVNLSVQSVSDVPRYTAIAIKEATPKAWEFARVKVDDDKHYEDMRSKDYAPVAQCVYRDNKNLRQAYLWVLSPNASIDGVHLGSKEAIDKKIDEARKRKARPVFRSAFEGAATVYDVIIAGAGNIAWTELLDQPFDACKSGIEKQKQLGWRPDHLYAYGTGASTQFGAILFQDPTGPEWDISWSLTPAQYEAELASRKAAGFRPRTAVPHGNDAGELRFSVIWLRYR